MPDRPQIAPLLRRDMIDLAATLNRIASKAQSAGDAHTATVLDNLAQLLAAALPVEQESALAA